MKRKKSSKNEARQQASFLHSKAKLISEWQALFYSVKRKLVSELHSQMIPAKIYRKNIY